MSRLAELARTSAHEARTIAMAHLSSFDRDKAIVELSRAVDLLSEVIDNLEEKLDYHTGSSDSHARLV